MALKSPVGACYSGDVMNKLNQDYDSVLYEQQRLQLLYSMKKKSIYTRDIMSFAENQAESRRELKGIDNRTTHSAMLMKIRDSKESLGRKIKERSDSIRDYLSLVGGNKYRLRKTIKTIRKRQEDTKKKLQSKR